MSPAEFKRIREKLDLSQAELAEILGLSGRVVVAHYEGGNRNPSALSVAVMRLFDELPEKKSVWLRESILNYVRREKKTKRRDS